MYPLCYPVAKRVHEVVKIQQQLPDCFPQKMLPPNSRKLLIFNWTSERIPVQLKGISANSFNVPVGQVFSGPKLELNYWYRLFKCRYKWVWIPSITSASQSKQTSDNVLLIAGEICLYGQTSQEFKNACLKTVKRADIQETQLVIQLMNESVGNLQHSP